MMLISSMKVTLLALVIMTCVGPSAGPPHDDDDFDILDLDDIEESEYPRDTDVLEDPDLSKSEEDSPQVEHKMSSDQMLKGTYKNMPGKDFVDAFDYLPLMKNTKGHENPTCDLDFKRMIQFPWTKSRKGKQPHGVSKIKNQYCRVSAPTGRPRCRGSTTDRCSSTFSLPPCSPSCPYKSKPTAPPTMAPPPTPPPTRKPCKPQSSKCHQKPRVRKLNPKTAKMLLKIIMDTKQHVLFTLEILNHMENEVLFRTPDTCRPQDCNMKKEGQEKERTMPKKKPAKSQKQSKFQSCGDYPKKGHSTMSMARAKKLRQKEQQLASIDPLQNWCPAATSNQANRVKNMLESALQPSGLNRQSHKKYRHYGQKQQPKMKNIPPGMVAILT